MPASPAPAAVRMDVQSWLMLVALATVWGGTFVFVEIILTAVPVLTLVAFRVGIAALTLWCVMGLLRIRLPHTLGLWASFAVMGLVNNVLPFSAIVWGQTGITAGLAAILNATTPLFAAIIAGMTLPDERLTPGKIAGLGLGLLGVAVMVGPGALAGLGENLPHQLAVVAAALSYGVAAVFGRRFRRYGLPPVALAAGQLTASSAVLVPLALVLDGPGTFIAPGPGMWVVIILNACLSTAFAYLLYFRILARAGATNTTLVTVLIPVVAVILGAFLLGERLTAGEFCGMALIFAGLAVIDGRLLRVGRSRHGLAH